MSHRRFALASAALLSSFALRAPTAAAEPPAADARDDEDRGVHLIGLGVAVGLDVVSEVAFKDALAPDACRWCAPPGFDASVHDHLIWDNPKRAASLSNLTAFVLAPLGAAGLLFVASASRADHTSAFLDDMIAVTEAAVYSQLAVQVLKFSVGRQRPDTRDRAPGLPGTNDDNLSFVSGHTALAFSLATAAGTVAQRRHYQLAPVIWATGLALATTTGYLRIAGDKHYLSDVVGGAAIGAAAGLVLPRLLHSLPAELAIVPSPSGLAVTGAF
jgi:membrane-associated phospholipid phosphatase